VAQYSIDTIFRSRETKHRLTLFSPQHVAELEASLFDKNGKPYVTCLASGRDRPAKPEEIVRQLWIRKLLEDYQYPKDRIMVERAVWFGSGVAEKSADVIVMHTDGEHPFIIFEVKKPKRKDGIRQLKSYCNAEGSPIGAWSNGEELVVLHREEPNVFTSIPSISTVGQTLFDVLSEPWTIDRLTAENRLVKEGLSLKRIILDLEDLVLANAGVDAFDEVFKLLYAKLYDEWAAINLPELRRQVRFRTYGETPPELHEKITGLFDQAKKKWPDVFSRADHIELTPSHLATCVSFLQDIRLFNANLQVIDEAFEYLVTQVAKGAKGQFFTPRWVIDMCVKMLNPKPTEYVIDPAAGSCGFLVHAIMWVAKQQITANGLPAHAREFAQTNVYAIDFDAKAIKIAKAMNLIAGDGKSNVYKANSLDPKRWEEPTKAVFRKFLVDDTDTAFQELGFDLLLTNPPFAGQVAERPILRQYRLAEKDGRTVARKGRDILFIERCLKMIRPGGRMAMVLPQGRLNNISDSRIRDFILERARLLAVVGLHPNTFKPHTSTKTSVIVLQKYTLDQLEALRKARSRHLPQWQDHLSELQGLADRGTVEEGDLPPPLISFLQGEFGEEEPSIDEDEEAVEVAVGQETPESLAERVSDLQERLSAMPPRAKGRAALTHAIAEATRRLASQSWHGRVHYLAHNEELLMDYREAWLTQMASHELDYPILFAVSEKGGKNSSGDPVYAEDPRGEFVKDAHGHLVVDEDLSDIANAFANFAKDQRLDFWLEE
jgi:type I restriction enzyme M protein